MPPRGQRTVGDAQFLGVNDRLKPEALPQGLGAEAINCRFRKGVAETRGGIFPLLNNVRQSTPFPLTFPINWTQNREALGEIIDAAHYEKPGNLASQIFLVDDDGVILAYRTRYASQAQEIPIAGQPDYRSQFKLIPAQDKLILLSSNGHWVMADFQDGFKPMDPPATGFYAPPSRGYGIYMQSRLLIPDRDEVWFSNTRDYENFHLNGRIFVNQGDSDDIVALSPFGNASVVVFKESSIYLLGSVFGPSNQLSARVVVSLLTKSFGILARDSVAHAGNSLIFLTRQGVHSVGLTPQNEVHPSAVPLSAPIDGLLSRVNWAYADQAFGEIHDNKYYLAVPIDGSTENNVVLVYDLISSSWQGHDDLGVKSFYRADYAGAERLHAVDHASNVFLYDYAAYDYGLFANESPHTDLIPKRNPVRWLRTHRGKDIATHAGAGLEAITKQEVAQIQTRAEKIGEIQNHLTAAGVESSITGSVSGSISGATSDSLYLYIEGSRPVEDDLAVAVPSIDASNWQYMHIPVTFITREYRLNEEFRASVLTLEIDSFNSSYFVSLILDGEEVKLHDYMLLSMRRSFDRRKYTTMKSDYDLRNPDESFSLPNREDYSIVLHDDGTLPDGMLLDKHRNYKDTRDISQYGRTIQVKIYNIQGKIKVRRVTLQLQRGQTDKVLK